MIARHRRSYDKADMVFDPMHYLPLLEQKVGALDQAAPMEGWDLPDEFATLRRLLEARMGALLDDQSPMPEDIIAPRVLTPGGLLVLGGAPKVGKSDLLISWLVHMAAVRRYAGTDAAHVYGGLMASLTSWAELRGIPYAGTPVGTIKRHATGKGNATKQAMMAAARARGFSPADDNEADAIAILLWALETRGGVQ